MKNLLLDNPVDEHLKPVKDSDGTSTVIELSSNKMRVRDLEVTGTTTGVSASDDTKLPLAGGTMTGNVDFGNNDITNIDSLDADKLSISGGTEMTGFIDADDMSTGASATTISSSESIKVYVDNSAGTILAYRDIGLNEAEASYNMTTSYAVPTDEFGITFTAPVGGNVEYVVENIWIDYGGSGAGDFFVGLSTANATSGYSALASYHEKNIGDNEGRYAQNVSSISWTLTGLSAGTDYTYYVGFKSSSTTGTPHISWGGDATGESPDIIIKAIALPSSIST